jgi:NAD(P)-dependent dehydrogenase (short-subunit alcohol dehydrogenase family)
LNSLAQHLAVEEPKIASIAIGPGRVDTDMQKELREKGSGTMSESDYAGFKTAFEEGKLNKPEWPGHVIARLALGTKPELSGKYLSWNATELCDYQDGK